MKIAIDNLLKQEDPPKRICHVVRPLGNDRYQVQDSMGRLFDVDCDINQTWQHGDGVTVSRELRIVGRAARFEQPKIYEV